MEQDKTKKGTGSQMVIYTILPLLFVVAFFVSFLKFGPLGVFETAVAPLEDVFIQRVIFEHEEITVEVYNNGPETVTLAQVMINDAYWKFDMVPDPADTTLEPREKGKVHVFYPWVSGEPQHIALLSSNGVLFTEEVAAAATTPRPDKNYVQAFVLLGLYVGVIPVLLGLLWLPVLRRLRGKWYDFLLSLTVGLLLFLGVDAAAEALELTAEIPSSFNGIGVFTIGFLLAIMALTAVSYRTEHLRINKSGHQKAITLGYLIALGIGLHNLGEGLAVGSAYAIGEVALGSTLVIGFMLHNITEGVAIIAPIARTSKKISDDLHRIVLMGILAGVPTIIGSLIGGFSYSTLFALFFLAIGAGAIFAVIYDILHEMAGLRWKALFTVTNVTGFLVGLLIMYVTGFLVV